MHDNQPRSALHAKLFTSKLGQTLARLDIVPCEDDSELVIIVTVWSDAKDAPVNTMINPGEDGAAQYMFDIMSEETIDDQLDELGVTDLVEALGTLNG